MLRVIDDYLNRLTMYRLVVYGLGVVAILAVGLGVVGALAFSPLALILSAAVLLVASFGINYALAKLFLAPANLESSLISGLILFLILKPATSLTEVGTLVLAAALAMASKYVLAWRGQNIFNPVAVTLVILGLLGSAEVLWWVATPLLLPVVAIVGGLILRKLGRFLLFLMFAGAALLAINIMVAWQTSFSPTIWVEVMLSWPLVFLGMVMLTEPSTLPPTRKLQLMYAVLVGVLFGSQFQIGPFYSSPELALVVGNMAAFAVGVRGRLRLRLKAKHELAPGVYEFIFESNRPPVFRAGQYLEWALPHVQTDSRGSRRYFTVASSPTESEVRLGVNMGALRLSSFKQALGRMKVGEVMWGSRPAGDFVLPANARQKLVFVAGGIGITPFRSMIQYLLDTKQKRDIVLLYVASTPDRAYTEQLREAERAGVRTIHILDGASAVPLTWEGKIGKLTVDLLEELIPDARERVYYISGPPGMASAYKDIISGAGVSQHSIVKDYFSGY